MEKQRRIALTLLSVLLIGLGLFLAWRGLFVLFPVFVGIGLVYGLAYYLSGSPVRAFIYTFALLVLVAIAVTMYQRPGMVRSARLAADHRTIQAMRSAAATYYGQHRSFPDHPGNYINLAPPLFMCVNLAYAYSSATGEIKITSTNTVEGDCQ